MIVQNVVEISLYVLIHHSTSLIQLTKMIDTVLFLLTTLKAFLFVISIFNLSEKPTNITSISRSPSDLVLHCLFDQSNSFQDIRNIIYSPFLYV